MSEIYKKLSQIQQEMKAPKNLFNKFGNYKYRNAEGILEAVKPYEKTHGVVVLLSDDIVVVGDRFYVKATAKIADVETGESVEVSAMAREEETKKGMDASQVTGACSSYARKYALNGLFLLDDTKDADSDENKIEADARAERENKKDSPEVTNQNIYSKNITANDYNALLATCKAKGVDVRAVLKKYGCEKTPSKMTFKQFNDEMKALRAMADKEATA